MKIAKRSLARKDMELCMTWSPKPSSCRKTTSPFYGGGFDGTDDDIEIETERYVGEYEKLTGRFVIDSNRQGLEIAFIGKPVLSIPGPSIPSTPVRFIDRNTARFASGNHVLDSLPIIFPGNDSDSLDHLTFALRVFPRL